MRASCRGFSQFGSNSSGNGAQRFQNSSRNHRSISGYHQHGHCFTDSTADAQYHPRSYAGNRIRNNHFIGSLPLRSSQSQTRFTHGSRTITHGVFRNGNNGRQCHDSQHNASCQPALSHREIEHLLYKRHYYNQPEEPVHHRWYTTQQFNNRFQPFTHFRTGYFGHINRNRKSERQRYKNRKKTHPQRARNQR